MSYICEEQLWETFLRGTLRVRESGMDMYTLLYLRWITNKDLLYSTGNSAQCYVEAWMGGEFKGRTDTWICMAASLHCSPETITTSLTGYTSIWNKHLKILFFFFFFLRAYVFCSPYPTVTSDTRSCHRQKALRDRAVWVWSSFWQFEDTDTFMTIRKWRLAFL